MNIKTGLPLSDEFLEKARIELNETESTKEKGLKELRAWIRNNPNIRKCPDGRSFDLLCDRL
jgi:hypothetical protein